MQLREKSALTNHVRTTGHHMDFENARILFNETDAFKREILESILINYSDIWKIIQEWIWYFFVKRFSSHDSLHTFLKFSYKIRFLVSSGDGLNSPDDERYTSELLRINECWCNWKELSFKEINDFALFYCVYIKYINIQK